MAKKKKALDKKPVARKKIKAIKVVKPKNWEVPKSPEDMVKVVIGSKFRSLQAGISHSVVAGVGRVVFQDLENTGNRFSFEDGVEWEEISERLRTFFMGE